MAKEFDRLALWKRCDSHRMETGFAERQYVTWTEVGKRIGISASTFTRLGPFYVGRPPDFTVFTLVAILDWLGETDLAPYLKESERHDKP